MEQNELKNKQANKTSKQDKNLLGNPDVLVLSVCVEAGLQLFFSKHSTGVCCFWETVGGTSMLHVHGLKDDFSFFPPPGFQLCAPGKAVLLLSHPTTVSAFSVCICFCLKTTICTQAVTPAQAWLLHVLVAFEDQVEADSG